MRERAWRPSRWDVEFRRDTEWHSLAACAPSRCTLGSTAFLPTVGDRRPGNRYTTGVDFRPALRVCQACPARVPCAAYAERHHLTFGVWGGRLLAKGPDAPARQRTPERRT